MRRALLADNPAFVTLEVEGTELVVRTTSTSARSARATLEDLLACLQVAERSARPTAESK
ncbi:MAG: hypothetical protein L3K10_07370 [Thermoplasmata archaeon]|nr:hypothetical protein [Thermoplasmata archaeon]